MINEKDLSDYYGTVKEIYFKALEDVVFFLEKALKENTDGDEIARIYTSSKVSKRVKTQESLLRKIRRDNIENLDHIPDAIEDILGIRISTPNKIQARKLFEWFQHNKGNWFCSTIGEPKLTPYTIEDRNKYSLRTGYQAYHITFIVDREYAPFTAIRKWPCELQIMSQVWEFWANYSRRYFYAASSPEVAQLLPYNAAISKILDSADDLMVATAELLLASEHGGEPAGEVSTEGAEGPQPAVEEKIAEVLTTPTEVETWLQENLASLISERAKIPNAIFLQKISDELNLYKISLDKLKEILSDATTKERYNRLLSINGIPYLPTYQQILCMILIYQNRDPQTILGVVNSQLWLLGIHLEIPPDRII